MITAQRLLFALASVVLAAIAASLFFLVVTVNGVTYLHIVQISLLVLCCLWLAWGFNMALAGIMSSGAPPRRRALTATRASAGHNGGVPLYRDEAVVLRTHKLGEADRIITLLTRQHGRVRAVARGVRRTTSRFGSRLEPFTHVDLQLADGRNLDTITQAETLTPFASGLGADYERYTAGTVMLETAERLVTEEKEPATQHFLLLVGGLRAMMAGDKGPGQDRMSHKISPVKLGRHQKFRRAPNFIVQLYSSYWYRFRCPA